MNYKNSDPQLPISGTVPLTLLLILPALLISASLWALPPSPPAPIRISGGNGYSVMLLDNGTLWNWGDNGGGQLATGDITRRYTPFRVGSDANWNKLSTGGAHTLALKADRSLWAWGSNIHGQLGTGNTERHYAPVKIGSATNWSALAGGDSFTVALRSNGTLWAWGQNTNGQLGTGDMLGTYYRSPFQIGTSTDWTAIAAGESHTVALRSDGTLWTWGNNNHGQLGTGNWTEQYSPVKVGDDTDWTAIAAGGYFTLALKANGTLWAWGDNRKGQVGTGLPEEDYQLEYLTPVQVGSDPDWKAIAAGSDHAIALKNNGTLWAWGYNFYGQLGINNNDDQNAPIQVGGDTNWGVIAAGDFHSLAIRLNATLWAWGSNQWGQLGLGDTVNRNTPTQVTWDNLPLDPPSARPDVSVGKKTNQFTGTKVYAPKKQLVTISSANAKPVTGYARLANQGTLDDVLIVRGQPGNQFFKVVWKHGKQNITAKMKSGKYRTAKLSSSSKPVALQATVTPVKKKLLKKVGARYKILKKRIDLPIRAQAESKPSVFDQAILRVQTKAGWLK